MSTLAFGRLLGQVVQFAYTVPDLDAAMTRYVDVLGVGPWFRRGPFSPPAARYRGEPTAIELSLGRAFTGDTMIELIQQHNEAPSVFRETIARQGYGFHHWAITTRDPAAEVARLASYGYPVVFEDQVPSGARVVYVDATAELPGMIEILEMNEAQEALYEGFHRAAATWDGTDPIREG
jgi:hypothetical protein